MHIVYKKLMKAMQKEKDLQHDKRNSKGRKKRKNHQMRLRRQNPVSDREECDVLET